MASSTWSSSSLFIPREDTLWYYIALLSVLSLLGQELSRCSVLATTADFEGFGDDVDDEDFSESSLITDLPIRSNLPPPTTLTPQSDFETDHGPPLDSSSSPPLSDPIPNKPSSNSFDFWDEDEFEGLPIQENPTNLKSPDVASPSKVESDSKVEIQATPPLPKTLGSFTVEIVCVSFLIAFLFNYFSGKKENENIALAWASRFATKDSIFDKNFSLLGTGDGKDTPLLLKEGQNVFKFYASGRRFCQGMLATMDLQSRHDLISRLYNMIVPCKDEITFEVYMNDDAMDNVVFALAKKKLAKVMHKELRDLQRFASLVTSGPNNRKWVADELMVITESKEVAGDLITETVLDQVFGDKAFPKFGKGFISMHFSDQFVGSHRKMLILKFALQDAKNMADMTRLVALVPYYIDLIGRYKLSSQARPKTEAARTKVAQEVYKELQNARQEALQKKKAEKRKIAEEAEAKLSAEVLRKREEKNRAKQMKKVMPKVKMTRAH
ncbi:Coiled-coil domain-containing protein [Thalictrum thalictroides]|uniref:Coiled-coil domain-containing protein n=1 Tax=Thalictrum thalictroides TaxID=46969 RepID=A0A7J6VC87_THATH|nr:Coiled-coil domain-containing protein [Thalictrum thalictroides]